MCSRRDLAPEVQRQLPMRNHLSMLLLAISSTALALPPHAQPGLVGGANHHAGDVGFVATYGRQPHTGEEKQRMHEHFVAIRAKLAAGHAPTPALEGKRAQLLGFLDAYIAKGLTPINGELPWRTPVFIDRDHTICAVGYLIEQSAGRPLAEKIATSHRFSFIEDIAKDMPEVRDWVAASGFTLEELGRIQPGYLGPEVQQWAHWKLKEQANGPYATDKVTGTIAKHRMEGAWQVSTLAGPDEEGVDKPGVRVGTGTFAHGAGAWTATYPDGKLFAKGPYVRGLPHGAWQLFHPSGNLAAEGSFTRGERTGTWRFYYDTAAKTPIAIGRFSTVGTLVGTWQHFDAKGGLLATSVVDTPDEWTTNQHQTFWSIGYLLDIKPGTDGIRHQIHQGSLDGGRARMDELATRDGKERIYTIDDAVFDASGHQLVAKDGGWLATECGWQRHARNAAKAGDVGALHGALYNFDTRTNGYEEGKACSGKSATLSPERAARVTALVDSMKQVRSASPEFITGLALGEGEPKDLPNLLAANMSLDIEWPHVDGKFNALLAILPGYTRG